MKKRGISLAIKLIIFDLDGTLLDVYERYARAYIEALDISEKNKKKIIRMKRRGKTPLQIIEAFLDNKGKKEVECYDDMRKRLLYSARLLKKDKPFKGINHALEALKNKNIILAILTLRPKGTTIKQLKIFNLERYFDKIVEIENKNSSFKAKQIGIKSILEYYKIQPSQAIVVGDTKYDILAGNKCGITTVGVLSGFSNFTELKKLRPNYILKDVNELFPAIFYP